MVATWQKKIVPVLSVSFKDARNVICSLSQREKVVWLASHDTECLKQTWNFTYCSHAVESQKFLLNWTEILNVFSLPGHIPECLVASRSTGPTTHQKLSHDPFVGWANHEGGPNLSPAHQWFKICKSMRSKTDILDFTTYYVCISWLSIFFLPQQFYPSAKNFKDTFLFEMEARQKTKHLTYPSLGNASDMPLIWRIFGMCIILTTRCQCCSTTDHTAAN